MTRVVVAGHAKINLHLGVGDLRADGYHELTTVFQSLALHDLVTVESVEGVSGVCGLSVSGLDAGEVPGDERNLAWRAAQAVFADVLTLDPAAELPGIRIHIDKRIPTAGGMAGGSADAAAALIGTAAVLREHGLPTPGADRLLDLATQLGSDVPFTLLGGTRIGTGRGELLEVVSTTARVNWVLAFIRGGLPTPRVFSTLDQLRADGFAPRTVLAPDALRSALAAGDVTEVATHLVNDLQLAATMLKPELASVLAAGVRSGALAGLVSGSGPTCVFLCADPESARCVAADLAAQGGAVIRTVTTTGPAPGAELV
ncbi:MULTISPECIES: 4-(cytidine 5'-diphospho)-2-C-methyl-D-erythritol kinase [unclassified Corynebacterium]|uniref:4-(cytidine 5'-diphospho)-2-C-methyl-D-erythritol kinase n=1 Tax=unclassified Corynebacterium TaxID=2624378 RepID=UPI003523F0E6